MEDLSYTYWYEKACRVFGVDELQGLQLQAFEIWYDLNVKINLN